MSNKNFNSDSQKLLVAIYKNVRIATQSIENILSSIGPNDITIELSRELNQYYIFEKEIVALSQLNNYNLKDNSFIQKTQVWISVKLNLLSSSYAQHIAEMMLVGTAMGVIDLVKAVTNYNHSEKEISNLANSVEGFERENIEKLFEFLKIKPLKNNNDNKIKLDNKGKNKVNKSKKDNLPKIDK